MYRCFALCLVVMVGLSSAATINKDAPTIRSNKPSDGIVKGPGFARVFSEFGEAGLFYDFTEYVPDLRVYDFDNIIRSACQTGLWFYYGEIEYNQSPGSVYWMHGIEYCGDMPINYADQTSSLRYAGSPFALNEDSFTLYEGEFFTGSEFWGNEDYYNSLDYLDQMASSLVLTGLSPWTFFTGLDYTGLALCVYPSTDHDVGEDGSTIDFGIFASFNELGFDDDVIRSAAKGCFSETVVRAPPLEALHRSANGAMGGIKRA